MNPPVETVTAWRWQSSMSSLSERRGIMVNEPPENFSESTQSPIVSSTSAR